MSQSSQQPTGPLGVGNVVSAGLRIYRDRFRPYFVLALKAYFWFLVPIYGWAKFFSISGQIARLAYSEVIERPETLKEAYRQTNPRKWTFLLAGILVSLIVFLTVFGLGIVFGVTAIIFIGFLLIPLYIFIYIWVYSRISIAELPIAIEDGIDATSAIGRSWELTKGAVIRLVGVYSVAFLLTLPLSILLQIVSTVIQLVFVQILPQDSAIINVLYFALLIIISFVGGALIHPFWQAIKAVIYYDLRSRREGIDIEIKDEPI